VRLGIYISAGAVIVPRLQHSLGDEHPGIRVITREGTTPALVRALPAGTLDLGVISSRPRYRPPDDELPLLITEVIDETTLVVAASFTGRFAGRRAASVDELEGVDWIASPSARREQLLRVWPGLAGRPRIAHTARDWLTKLQLVAADCGLPRSLGEVLPDGVQIMRVEGGPHERRRACDADAGTAVAFGGRRDSRATPSLRALTSHCGRLDSSTQFLDAGPEFAPRHPHRLVAGLKQTVDLFL
jgi:LysR substrate binding domain